MDLITFKELHKLRKSKFKIAPVDFIQSNLNNKHHNNLHDPFIGAISEDSCLVHPDYFVKTRDGYIISDMGYRGKLPNNEYFNKTQVYEYVNETCFLLGGDSDEYHWLLHWLPRMFIYKRLNLSCPIVVNEQISDVQIEIFKYFFPEFESNLYQMKGYTGFRNLIIPNFFTPPMHSPFAISNIRIMLMNLYGKTLFDKSSPQKIYLKNPLGKKKFVNEDQLIEVLKKKSFEVYDLNGMNFFEQVSLFVNCKEIVSPYQSGLVGLAFCFNLSKVLELTDGSYSKRYWSLGQLCGVDKYMILQGQISDGSDKVDINHGFFINTNEVEKMMF